MKIKFAGLNKFRKVIMFNFNLRYANIDDF